MNHKTDVQRKSEKNLWATIIIYKPFTKYHWNPPRRSLAFARFKTQKFFIDILEVNVLENYC